ncbi:NUDIX domain-containing protein [Pilimelia columellifera]|uniref:Nudix hydrolase domain-containing protein n=1 Tax=Pilimelia columellifera subsp. columellifera TaxID=706583 RepID=A0ABN3NAR6_9ACTN
MLPNNKIPEHLRSWSVPWPLYMPTFATPPELQPGPGLDASVAAGWAEPAFFPAVNDWPQRQAAALIPFQVVGGRPRNPSGRTGYTGRRLGRWGENQAADPIVTTGAGADRRVLLIRRDDCGQWAIPGGMVDPGETVPAALVRELREETGVDLAGYRAQILTTTYVDDPRNTDESWVVSTVAHYRLPETSPATAGSDALEARWWPFADLDTLLVAVADGGGRLYAAHRRLLGLCGGGR